MNPELILVAAILVGIGGLVAFIIGWQRYRLRRSRLDPVVMSHAASVQRVLGSLAVTFLACGLVPAIAVPLDTERQHGLAVMLGVLAVALGGITGSMFGPWLRAGTLTLDRDARSLTLELPGAQRERIDLRQPYTLEARPAPYQGVIVAVRVSQGMTEIAFTYPWPKLLDEGAALPDGREAMGDTGPRLDVAARGIHEALEKRDVTTPESARTLS